jgi:hypothetical protein
MTPELQVWLDQQVCAKWCDPFFFEFQSRGWKIFQREKNPRKWHSGLIHPMSVFTHGISIGVVSDHHGCLLSNS